MLIPIPVGLPAATAVARLIEEVRDLESDLDIALELIGQLAVHLRPILGEQALGQMWRDLAEAEVAHRPAELQGKIEALVARGDEPGVLRQLRDLTRLTWDEVYTLRSRWANFTPPEKRRLARRLIYRRVLQTGAHGGA